LIEHFVQKFAQRQGEGTIRILDGVIEVLWHDWPGNIRELQNVIDRGVIMKTGPVLSRRP
jgi:DNA-binding NtrC family response regulator